MTLDVARRNPIFNFSLLYCVQLSHAISGIDHNCLGVLKSFPDAALFQGLVRCRCAASQVTPMVNNLAWHIAVRWHDELASAKQISLEQRS
jgi:hypothetical protein